MGRVTWRLEQADAVEWLLSHPGALDLIITDPAYESLEKHRARGTTTRLAQSKSSSNEWFSIFPNERFVEFFAAAYAALPKNGHLYVVCDPETAFIIKPLGEFCGFKFWKPIVWDKCLAPDTPVRTARGVVLLDDVTEHDRVWTPDGRLVKVLGVRRTRAPAVRLTLTSGVSVVAAKDHRFVDVAGQIVEAGSLQAGATLGAGSPDLEYKTAEFDITQCIDVEERVVGLPHPATCLFCGRVFSSPRAAAAHQARFCAHAVPKKMLAAKLGVSPKCLGRWLNKGRLPAMWAETLGLGGVSRSQLQLRLQNDSTRWYPASIQLDYGWGKLIGLYAAEGSKKTHVVSFALHRDEKHLQHHISRTVRTLGLDVRVRDLGGQAVSVEVQSKFFVALIAAFVGGVDAASKFFKEPVYTAPLEFQRGVFDGLIEGDGYWSDDEHRETFTSASLDLASFVFRFARHLQWTPTLRRCSNDHAGAWRTRFDPAQPASHLTVSTVEDVGAVELIDIAIDDAKQLFQLHDGLVTHNCRMGMGYHYRARYEFVLFFEKGKRKLNDLGVPDVLGYENIHDILRAKGVRNGYPTEKPVVGLLDILVLMSSDLYERVGDPFCGSGATGEAALTLGRDFLGGDVSPYAIETSRERLTAVEAALWAASSDS